MFIAVEEYIMTLPEVLRKYLFLNSLISTGMQIRIVPMPALKDAIDKLLYFMID
jgi:hypothetical protein